MFATKAKFVLNSCFAVGFDTYIRLIDLKYYGYSVDEMLTKLADLKDQYGTSFAVAGRVEQTKP